MTEETLTRYRLSLVREEEVPYRKTKCHTPEGAAYFLHNVLEDAWQEKMGAILLDNNHITIGYHIAYSGCLTRTSVEPRGLLVPALLTNAAGIVAFHNHPSGNPKPSPEDYAFTRRLDEAAKVVGVRCLDHLIIGEKPSYVSLRRRGGW